MKIYSKCGKIAHARNPRGATIDYQYFEDRIPEWVREIKALLSIHIIRIEEGKEFYLFQMNTPPNGSLHIQGFEAFSLADLRSFRFLCLLTFARRMSHHPRTIPRGAN